MLLHGRGADEHDLHPLLDVLDPDGDLLGITPRAPLALPPGGAHWYRLGGIPTPEPASFHDSFAQAASFLDSLPVPLDRVVLGGFSQGAVMTLALGLGRGRRRRPAAILALSGFLPRVPGLELDLEELDGYSVTVAHGTLDPVIPVTYGREVAAELRAAGADVLWHEAPVAHAIPPELLPALRGRVSAAVPR